MNEQVEGLGIIGTLEQMVKILGFHDLGSFLIASIFGILALAFVISMVVFFAKKRKERKAELLKVVHEVQKELEKGRDHEWEEHKVTKIEPLPVEKKPIEKAPKIEVRAQAPEPKIAEPKAPLKVEIKPIIEKEEPEVAPLVEKKSEEQKSSLGSALKNTRGGFIQKLGQLFSKNQQISDQDFEEMESILFTADIGAKTAQKLLDGLKGGLGKGETAMNNLKVEMGKIFDGAKSSAPSLGTPQVIMFVGVNGAGKTTSIGKLGANLKNLGKTVLFAAGDTFRAAATEQLKLWGERSGIEVVSGKENADPASVLFEAIEKGKAMGVDYILCDTAGRLHTKSSLMEELAKVYRVVGKAMPGAPHEVLLVVDATMGQNAIAQAREFAQAAPLTGVVLSKLDGTAKGGVALGIVDELKVPIRYVGIGEKASDLKDFSAKEFISALLNDA
jgi:fused signal recognition particle receptor